MNPIRGENETREKLTDFPPVMLTMQTLHLRSLSTSPLSVMRVKLRHFHDKGYSSEEEQAGNFCCRSVLVRTSSIAQTDSAAFRENTSQGRNVALSYFNRAITKKVSNTKQLKTVDAAW